MRKRTLSLALALVMALGLAVPALAFTTPDFTDLPSDNWAYEPVMRMADAGVIKGTGGGAFSPEMKVSVAQFLTLVGRVVFPDVKAEGEDWYGPYITAAQEGGLLAGTQVDTSKPEAEISRYDMAVILRGAAKQLGVAEKAAQPSQVADYGEIPTKYAEAVLAVYGMGLIRGDQNGNFNGANTMMRNETATVMDRLIALKDSSTPGGSTEPEEPVEPQSKTVMATMAGELTWYEPSYWQSRSARSLIDQVIPYELRYTEDGGKTYQVITSSKTTYYDPDPPKRYPDDPVGYLDSTPFEVDRSLFENENGQFYISAETDYRKPHTDDPLQHLVTWDRRDVRSSIYPIQFTAATDGDYYYVEQVDVPLVPPTSNTVTVVFEGWCEALVWTAGDKFPHNVSPSDITVKLAYCPDGHRGWSGTQNGGRYVKVLGEAVSDSEGNFRIEAEIDELDYYPEKSLYTVYAEGTKEGEYCYFEPGRIVTMSELLIGHKQVPLTVRNYSL